MDRSKLSSKNKKEYIQKEIEALSKEVIDNAEIEAEKIISRAKEEAKKMLNEARLEVLNETRRIYNTVKARSERLGNIRLYNIRLRYHKELITEREKIIQDIFNKLRERLKEKLNSIEYKNFLYNSIINMLNTLTEIKIYLILNENDKNNLDIQKIKDKLENKNIEIFISEKILPPDEIGGYILEVPSKKFHIKNTINEIIELKKDELRSLIIKKLNEGGVR